MAALSDTSAPNLWELNKLRPQQLTQILEEETQLWRERLDWDFLPSVDLVRRFLRMKALSGYALTIGDQAIGYSYYVCEQGKGLIGDLYVLRKFRALEHEDRLLNAVLEAMLSVPAVERVEAQLMMLPSPFDRDVPHSEHLRRHPRNFMAVDLRKVDGLPPGPAAGRTRIVGWTHELQEETARLITASYRGHIDGEINDQYRSVAGARRFLLNIVQYPGCGNFFQAGSFQAVCPEQGELCGISLSSLISSDAGHITQICTAPSARGTGVGYELLRHSLRALANHGCRSVSLTVTAANVDAIRLYERMGFTTAHRFAAYVWEGF